MRVSTLCERFLATASRLGDAVALCGDGQPSLSWREFAARAEDFAFGFRELGVSEGDTVALITRNTSLFHVLDMALMLASATPFSIAANEPAERIAQLLEVAECKLVLVENRHLELVRKSLGDRTAVIVVAFDGDRAVRPDLSLAEIEATGREPGCRDEPLAPVTDAGAVATLIFTSGTTGTPKAVQLSHRAISVSLDSFDRLAPYGDGDDHFISYLPLSHIAERFMTYYSAVAFGGSIHCVTDAAMLYDEIARVRPTRFFGVPRVYEKLADRARAQIRSSVERSDALDRALAGVRAQQSGEVVTLRSSGATTDAFVDVRTLLGFDRTRYLGVATAPSSRDLLEFFLAIGLPVGDIWGMSEAIMCTANPVGRIRLGSVGVFLDGVEATVADDGELLVRGPNVFSGYKGDPARTAELVDHDGWVHTGDLGAIDEDGYLSILGRKKELMITATGKNLMPAVIEGAVKSASRLIDHVHSVADGRRYVTALISLDREELERLAGTHGLSGAFDELAASPPVQAEIRDAVGRANKQLSHPESVRAWRIVGEEWLPGGDEVTPTMKLRRAEISRKYADVIDQLYEE